MREAGPRLKWCYFTPVTCSNHPENPTQYVKLNLKGGLFSTTFWFDAVLDHKTSNFTGRSWHYVQNIHKISFASFISTTTFILRWWQAGCGWVWCLIRRRSHHILAYRDFPLRQVAIQRDRELQEFWVAKLDCFLFSFIWIIHQVMQKSWENIPQNGKSKFKSQTTRKSEDFRPYSAVQSRKWKEENKKTFCIYCSQGKQLKCSGYFYNST